MKKNLVIALSLLAICCLSTNAELRVLSVQGNVMVTNPPEHPARNQEIVNEKTELNIPPHGKISILNDANNAVFHSKSGPINVTVKDIINGAKNSAFNAMLATIRQIYVSATGKGENKPKQENGVLIRDFISASEQESMIENEIAAMILADDVSPTSGFVTLSQVIEPDSTWHFIAKNITEKPLYINVAILRQGNSPKLLFEFEGNENGLFCVPLPPGEIELNEYHFYGTTRDSMRLIVSPEPFDSNDVDLLLQWGEETNEKVNHRGSAGLHRI